MRSEARLVSRRVLPRQFLIVRLVLGLIIVEVVFKS